MHTHLIEDANGDICDVVYFCSDGCHHDYCVAHPDLSYEGWNGCHEGGGSVEFCAQCGVAAGGTYECECQRDNVVVGRFVCDTGEKCEHGNWLQLPAEIVERMG